MSKLEETLETSKGVRIVYKLFLAFVGAVLFRLRGGLSPALPRPFDQMLFALGYAALIYKRSGRNVWWFGAVLILTAVALATGHGQYMDLGRFDGVGGKETLDFIVEWVWGEDVGGNYWRDLFGLCLTGIVITLPAGLALLWFREWIAGVVIGLSGLLKGLAYALSWAVGFDTAGGEYLTGFLLWGVIIIMWGRVKDGRSN